jgi:glycosyltransferase involved in cell wall biosynthesis
MKQKTVLLLYTNYSTFVAKDDTILRKKYHVINYEFRSQKSIFGMLKELLKQKFFLLQNIWKVDIVYSWFSDFHSFLPFLFAKLLGKKTIVIVGGFDAVSIPELNYGLFHKKDLRQRFGIWTYKLSDYIIPVDESLIDSMNFYANPKGLKVGVKAYVPGLKAIFKSIPTGYNPDNWIIESKERKNSVMAFGYAGNMQKFVGKGYDFMIEVAKKMPDVEFHLVSIRDKMKSYAESIAPQNVRITDSLPQNELLDELSKHKVYALLSMSEGLPSSLCEAMLCGCVPVGSNVGGIKNVIGDCGFLINHKDIDEAVDAIRKALATDSNFAKCGRQRISEILPIDLREREILKVLES